MKKMIRFTLLVLMIAGVFIFAPGERVAAATDSYDGFTVYSYTTSDTTHDIADYLDSNDYLIFIEGELVYEFGNDLSEGTY
ncbi:MAG: hypothetical protein RBT45_05870, partial [Acholeplasmataceae bacterium]|nr:hypothetical protein [Acholeplasmataceae bacterium]